MQLAFHQGVSLLKVFVKHHVQPRSSSALDWQRHELLASIPAEARLCPNSNITLCGIQHSDDDECLLLTHFMEDYPKIIHSREPNGSQRKLVVGYMTSILGGRFAQAHRTHIMILLVVLGNLR